MQLIRRLHGSLVNGVSSLTSDVDVHRSAEIWLFNLSSEILSGRNR